MPKSQQVLVGICRILFILLISCGTSSSFNFPWYTCISSNNFIWVSTLPLVLGLPAIHGFTLKLWSFVIC